MSTQPTTKVRDELQRLRASRDYHFAPGIYEAIKRIEAELAWELHRGDVRNGRIEGRHQ